VGGESEGSDWAAGGAKNSEVNEESALILEREKR